MDYDRVGVIDGNKIWIENMVVGMMVFEDYVESMVYRMIVVEWHNHDKNYHINWNDMHYRRGCNHSSSIEEVATGFSVSSPSLHLLICALNCFQPLRRQCQHIPLVAAVVTTTRDRTSGQLSLGGRMNSRIRRETLERIVGEGDRNYIWELRMNTNSFANLCELFQVQGGLKEDGHIQSILFTKATPVEEDCPDPTWRRFKVELIRCCI
ncbi:hypothetical protein Ahy_B06g083309 [Arachis hypogaea]|uniref:Uncharacterized protein n=1 Tax=Arachis hypogaea TaxID=3818 RepID=A0A444YPS4_ARAHY|nr:hypothetical protein Ahy_B06g083309 [Arachis hypogaea]